MTDTTFTYVLLAHTDPQGVLRLVRRIRHLSPTGRVVVRADGADLLTPAEVDAAGGTLVVGTVKAQWGSWELAEASLEGLRAASRTAPAGYYVVVSGQDYPVRNLAAWEREVTEGGADAVLAELPPHPDDHEFTWRIPTLPLRGDGMAARIGRHLVWRLGRLLPRSVQLYPGGRAAHDGRFWFGLPRRSGTPEGITVVKRSQWMTLSGRAVEHVLASRATRPDLVAFFRTVRIPDEAYIASLVTSEPSLTVALGTTSGYRRAEGASSPDWVDRSVMDEALRGAAPFVRKIPAGVDPAVLADADARTEPPDDPAPAG